MPNAAHQRRFFEKLAEAGLSRRALQQVMDPWWSEAVLEDPAAFTEFRLHLAYRFGLDLEELLRHDPVVKYDVPPGTKFKRSIRLTEQDVTPSASLVHSIARIVAAATPKPFVPLSGDPMELRREALSRGWGWISLGSLQELAWEHGIPVIHLSGLPDDFKKMDAVAVVVDGRPVVVLSKKSRYKAWLLFILAHELGHCALGHLTDENELLIDESVGEEAYLYDGEDSEERQADAFAITLLNGSAGTVYRSAGTPNKAQLKRAALDQQASAQVDAGHVILNYAFNNQMWALGNAALELLDAGDARHYLNDLLFRGLDLEQIPRGACEFLFKMSGFSPSSAIQG